MSIIYEALKKVEQTKTKNAAAPRAKRKVYLTYLLVACLGIIIARLFFNLITPAHNFGFTQPLPASFDTTAAAKRLEVTQPPGPAGTLPVKNGGIKKPEIVRASLQPAALKGKEPSAAFILNGIFFSEGKAYALINNQIVVEGDALEGATVMQINPEAVILKDRQGLTLTLSCS